MAQGGKGTTTKKIFGSHHSSVYALLQHAATIWGDGTLDQ